MNLSASSLAKLATEFDGYLEGSAVDSLFQEFDIKFAAGHWSAGEFFDRFCPVGYNVDNPTFDQSVVAQIERVKAAGIAGIEFHDSCFLDAQGVRDSKKFSDIQEALKATGVIPTNMNFMTWGHPKWRLGGITNPDPGLRKECLALIRQGIDLAADIGCKSCGLWPGSDGWDYHFEVDYGHRTKWFIEGCVEITQACVAKGLAFGTEPKQKEPREMNMITNTVAKAALFALEVNRQLGKDAMGICIDYGHEQMVGNTPAESLYTLKAFKIPIANFHINGAKYNSNDEDRIAGTDDIWRLVEFCYAAIDTGYDGWFGEDQFTYRTDPTKSMALSREFFANCMKKALKIYARKANLDGAISSGDAVQTIEAVKKIIYNG